MYLVGFPQMQQLCSLSEIITSAFISIISPLNNSIGDISGFINDTYDSIGAYIQYCIDNGYFPDINNLPLIPTMTSNTTPSGKVTNYSYVGNSFPVQTPISSNNSQYYAFDGKDNTCACIYSENITGAWLGYEFAKAKTVNKVIAKMGNWIASNSFTVKYQYYNENSAIWVDGGSVKVSGYANGQYGEFEFNIKNPIPSKKHRLYVVDKKVDKTSVFIVSFQLYGH